MMRRILFHHFPVHHKSTLLFLQRSFLKIRNPCEFGTGWCETKENNGTLKSLFFKHMIYTTTNCMTKGKNKGNVSKSKKNIVINEEELEEVICVEALKAEMEKAIHTLKEEYIHNVSLKPIGGVIENLPINYNGKEYRLYELVQVTKRNPQLIVLNCSEVPQAIPIILQHIRKSGMNINPQQDGATIFIPVPKITKEYREVLSKNAKLHCNKCKHVLQQIQNKFIQQILSRKAHFSEDLIYSCQQQVHALELQHVQQAEKIFANKQKELLESNA